MCIRDSYSSYLILQKEPGNKYLEKIIAKSLTGLTKFRNSKDDEVYAEKARFETYEGEQQQLYFLLWAMNDVELNVMSLNYAFNLHLKYPEDKEILPICESLVNDLVFYHFNDEHDFYEDKTISKDSLYALSDICLLYTSDAADERSSVDLGGRRIIKKKKSL